MQLIFCPRTYGILENRTDVFLIYTNKKIWSICFEYQINSFSLNAYEAMLYTVLTTNFHGTFIGK